LPPVVTNINNKQFISSIEKTFQPAIQTGLLKLSILELKERDVEMLSVENPNDFTLT
jgi:hypothetical protein